MNIPFTNKVVSVNEKQASSVLTELKAKYNPQVVVIDGTQTRSWEGYVGAIEEGFCFPSSCVDSMDRYLDWIRDLSWLSRDAYVVIIKDANSFLENNLELKEEILCDLSDVVLPFWAEEVEHVVVDGKSKLFMVLLVS